MAKTDNNIDKAFEILETISLSKEERAAYLSREMALHDEATKLSEAEERGEERKAIKAAINFLKLGVSEEVVAKGTELPIEKIRELKKNILN